MRSWYSLFSHTGSETAVLQSKLSNTLFLETAITTNMDYNGSLNCLKLPTGKLINQWLTTPGNVKPGSLITLNGYMRILPAEVIDYLVNIGCNVLNGHPAPILLYPELKGKDPQERLFEGIKSGEYLYIGSVLHTVDAGVDTGKVVHWDYRFANPQWTKQELYSTLHDISELLWLELLEETAGYVK